MIARCTFDTLSDQIMNRYQSFPLVLLTVLPMGCTGEYSTSADSDAPVARADNTGEHDSSDAIAPRSAEHPGMIWIAGGRFRMGSDDEISRLNERPVHQVEVDGFFMDVTPVTNADFRRFTDATGYLTIAERTPTWEELQKSLPPGTPKPDDSVFVAGSMVFVASEGPVDLRDMASFWQWTPGADWMHPEGPESDINGRDDHPVVQIAWEDAVAYAKWCGKRLPTEAEWEFAARGGSEGTRYFWGDEFAPDGKFMANTWTGDFPYRNTQEDGFFRTAPVKSFAPNDYGLYGMAGNVWNWCSDRYRPDTFVSRSDEEICSNPTGPGRDLPGGGYQTQRVVKGGSFLCHPDYCASYRPSARRGLPADTGMSHVSFRCVVSGP